MHWARASGKGNPAPNLLRFNEVSISMCNQHFDFQKTFFKVPHKRLLKKLHGQEVGRQVILLKTG